MGAKYSSNSISGYNSTPPSDDGTVSEANKVKWSVIKNKLTDPAKVLAEAINTSINTALNYGPISVVSAAVTLGASHNNQFIELSGAATPTLGSADGLGAGWFCDVKNIGASAITVARTKSGDMINDTTADVTMNPLDYIRFVVNAAASGFNTIQSKIATQAEVTAGTISDSYLTPKSLAGMIATQAEVDSGTDTVKYVTPATLAETTTSGTWTPVIHDSSATNTDQTYSTQSGNFTKIGNRVFITGTVALSSLGSLTGGDQARIAGFPYTSDVAITYAGGLDIFYGNGLAVTAGNALSGEILGNSTYSKLWVWDATTGVTQLTLTELSGDGSLAFNGSYQV